MQYDIICGKCGEGYGMFDYHECNNVDAVKSDGGPSSYYDFMPGWKTWNDFAEWKALNQWGPYSLHFKDVGKLMCRFGAKDGTSQEYDLNKGVYSFLRMKEMMRRGSAREYLIRLLDDPQFSE